MNMQSFRQQLVNWYLEAKLAVKIAVGAIAIFLVLSIVLAVVLHFSFAAQTEGFLRNGNATVKYDPAVAKKDGQKAGEIVASAFIAQINAMLEGGWFGYQPNKPWAVLLPDNMEYTQLGMREAIQFYLIWFNSSGVATASDAQVRLIADAVGKMGRDPRIYFAVPTNATGDYYAARDLLSRYISELNAGKSSVSDVIQREAAVSSLVREAMRRIANSTDILVKHNSIFGADDLLYSSIGVAKVTYAILLSVRYAMEPTIRAASPGAMDKFDEALEALRISAEYKPWLALANNDTTRSFPFIDDTLREHAALMGVCYMKLAVLAENLAGSQAR